MKKEQEFSLRRFSAFRDCLNLLPNKTMFVNLNYRVNIVCFSIVFLMAI